MAQLAVIVMWRSQRPPPDPTRSLPSSATKSPTTQNAASFKTQGVLAPLLVRELDESQYEVIAGARRLRAAKLAELKNVPVRIVKLTDAEAIEAQCVDLSVVGKLFFVDTQRVVRLPQPESQLSVGDDSPTHVFHSLMRFPEHCHSLQ